MGRSGRRRGRRRWGEGGGEEEREVVGRSGRRRSRRRWGHHFSPLPPFPHPSPHLLLPLLLLPTTSLSSSHFSPLPPSPPPSPHFLLPLLLLLLLFLIPLFSFSTFSGSSSSSLDPQVKCTQYWPNTGSQQYANITVTIMNTVNHADFVIRHFQIKSVSCLLQYLQPLIPTNHDISYG